MDMSMDGSPIIDKTHIEGLYLNCGWCYGGFKATPASGRTFAHTIAQDRPHELNEGYSLNRFSTGHLIWSIYEIQVLVPSPFSSSK